MIKQSDLATVVTSQKERLVSADKGLERDLLNELPENPGNHALISVRL